MLTFALAALAIALYLLAATWQWRRMAPSAAPERPLAATPGTVRVQSPTSIAALLALAAHGAQLWQLAHVGGDWRFGLFVAMPLAAWVVAALALLDSWWRPVSCLLVAVFPIAAVTVAGSLIDIYRGSPMHGLGAGMAVHIALSVLAYGLLAIAAVQALALAVHGYGMKRHRATLLRRLPPQQSLERMLFQTLWAATALLATAIASGAVAVDDLMAHGLAHKTVFSLLSVGLLLALLWGHHRFGWRGFIAVRWTLGSFACLALAWFGVHFVLEVLLGRV